MMEASALGQGRGDGSSPNFADLVLRHPQDLEDTSTTWRPTTTVELEHHVERDR